MGLRSEVRKCESLGSEEDSKKKVAELFKTIESEHGGSLALPSEAASAAKPS